MDGMAFAAHHETIGFQITVTEVAAAPVPHSDEDGHQTTAQIGKGIDDLRRYNRKNLPVDQIIGFQFSELLGQHLGGGSVDDFPQFGKTQISFGKMPENQSLVLTANQFQCGTDWTIFVAFHQNLLGIQKGTCLQNSAYLQYQYQMLK